MTILSGETILLFLLFFLLAVVFVLNRAAVRLNKKRKPEIVSPELTETILLVKQYRTVFTFFVLFVLLFIVGHYFTVIYHAEAHVLEWLNLIVRWAHVVFGLGRRNNH